MTSIVTPDHQQEPQHLDFVNV